MLTCIILLALIITKGSYSLGMLWLGLFILDWFIFIVLSDSVNKKKNGVEG
jgi:hypothetical protein